MEWLHYREMQTNLQALIDMNILQDKKIYLFGHCNATEELADLLLKFNYKIEAILDNSKPKQGSSYREIQIVLPEAVLEEETDKVIVCIVARAYEAMRTQLRKSGYKGRIEKLVDYNTYAEYSLSHDTIERKCKRIEKGMELLHTLQIQYKDCFTILCPFAALGDIYFVMSYLPYFLGNRNIERCVIGVIGNASAQVVGIFGDYHVEVYGQNDMDAMIQAALYTKDSRTFIPHQDRPYIINLSKSLYIKKITLDQIYCCGVFGLPEGTQPYKPAKLQQYKHIDMIEPGNSVIFSPYAKSVVRIHQSIWNGMVERYRTRGYKCYTNVVNDEIPLPNTIPISPSVGEVQSVVERAGTFIGIRSGLCDVIREAECVKVAFYPDYYYGDTQWKALDMYELKGWKNIVIDGTFDVNEIEL